MRKIFYFATIADAATPWQRNFQTPASAIREKIVDLHHDIRFFLIAIVIFVSWILARILYHFNDKNLKSLRVSFAHHSFLEKGWTYLPTIILRLIASPSFSLLYAIDELCEPQLAVKVIGHQWYWSYEAINIASGFVVNFDSYRVSAEELNGGLRLLEVDSRPLSSTSDLSWGIEEFELFVAWLQRRFPQLPKDLLRFLAFLIWSFLCVFANLAIWSIPFIFPIFLLPWIEEWVENKLEEISEQKK